MKRLVLLFVCAVLAVPTTRVSAQGAPSSGPPVIASGDVLRLTIYREEELSGLKQVPNDGVVVFGMIGPLKVTGMTSDSLRTVLVDMYGKYLVNYTIALDLLLKVTVGGAVNTPGVYTLDATNTVSDAIAIAGGVTPGGRMDRVELRRDGHLVEVLLADRTIADSPVRSGDQLFVPERSYLSRNGSTLAAVLSGVVGLIVALATR